ncbi:MAG: PilZ domain-containing protein [Chitinispirillaceae bacterium]|nr:PilZ domain-containing protein [Chitinispirillaceae bacterium]
MSFVQREHYRVPINVPVRIELGPDAVLEATCKDISMGGMGLLLEKEITPSSYGMVRMQYEQEHRKILFTAKFSVAWSRAEPRSAGIKFVEIDGNSQSSLAQILINRLQELEGTSTESP